MKHQPLNIIVISETQIRRRDPLFESISSSIRVGDKVWVVDEGIEESVKDGNFTRLSLGQLTNNVLSKDGNSVILTPSCYVTKMNLDLVRRRLDEGWRIVSPRSNALPLYQCVLNPVYVGRSQMRTFQQKWHDCHDGLYTSTPFTAVEGVGLENHLLLKSIARASSISPSELAWALSQSMSDENIAIKIDDSQYLHLERKYDYRVELRYEESPHLPRMIDKVIVDQTNAERRVVASSNGGTKVLALAMIVKNEEERLKDAIESVRELVEEVNIVDTGSNDDTLSILDEMGIEALHFEWVNDFGAARDFALSSTNSDWVIQLDADEVFQLDREAFIKELAGFVGNYMAAFANIYNHDWINLANAKSHQMLRLARRTDTSWDGMIHEQLFDRYDLRGPIVGEIKSGHIDHFGYKTKGDYMARKSERNLQIAKSYYEIHKDSISLIHLARTYQAVGQTDVTVELLTEAVTTNFIDFPWLPVAYRVLIDIALEKSDLESAERWDFEFARNFPGRADQIARRALIHARSGKILDALDILRSLPLNESYPGDLIFDRNEIATKMARFFGENGSYVEACSILFSVLEESGTVEVHPALYVEYMEKAGIAPIEFYRRVPPERRVSVFGLILQIVLVDPELASRFLVGILGEGVSDLVVLATAAEVAKFASLGTKLEVSAALRNLGVTDSCPLISSARDEDSKLPERLSSAYLAFGAFHDIRGREIANEICDGFAVSEVEDAISAANALYQLDLPMSAEGFLAKFGELEKSVS